MNMSEKRYSVDIPSTTFPALYVRVGGLTKKQVIDITREMIVGGIYPDSELTEFIIENSEFTNKGDK